jgi:hypothetical protein
MANTKQDYNELCINCGKEVKPMYYVNRCPETNKKGLHYVCESCKTVSSTRKVEKK